MARFVITATARATIRETWEIEAASEEEARAQFDDRPLRLGTIELMGDEIIGDEEDRQIETISLVVEPNAI